MENNDGSDRKITEFCLVSLQPEGALGAGDGVQSVDVEECMDDGWVTLWQTNIAMNITIEIVDLPSTNGDFP